VCVLPLAHAAPLVGAQTGGCPTFGTDQAAALSRSREERIFLNFEAPSQCRGNVTSWEVCYYNSRTGDDDDDDDDIRYGAKLMIYRRESPSSAVYRPVAQSIKSVQLRYNDVGRSFRCMTMTVAQVFEIRENDVVGACVWDKGDVNPLYLIGDTRDSAASQHLYQYDRSSYDDCTSGQIGTVDVSRSDFIRQRELKLHLYANTGTHCISLSNDSRGVASKFKVVRPVSQGPGYVEWDCRGAQWLCIIRIHVAGSKVVLWLRKTT
jgi:hypothetical protein